MHTSIFREKDLKDIQLLHFEVNKRYEIYVKRDGTWEFDSAWPYNRDEQGQPLISDAFAGALIRVAGLVRERGAPTREETKADAEEVNRVLIEKGDDVGEQKEPDEKTETEGEEKA